MILKYYICIYVYKNNLNENVYVGQSTQPKIRKLKHIYFSNVRKNKSYLHNAMTKHGIENFTFTIIDELFAETKKETELWGEEMETFYIKFLNSKVENGKGYNITDGGKHSSHSEETKEKISKSNTGRKNTEEHKRNVSVAQKGKKLSDAHKEKISIANKGKGKGRKVSSERAQKNRMLRIGCEPWNKDKKGLQVAWNKGKTGGKLSDETKRKMSKSRSGKKHKPHSTVTKSKISLTHTGKKLSDETKQKMSLAKKGIKRGSYKKSL